MSLPRLRIVFVANVSTADGLALWLAASSTKVIAIWESKLHAWIPCESPRQSPPEPRHPRRRICARVPPSDTTGARELYAQAAEVGELADYRCNRTPNHVRIQGRR